MPVFLAFLQGGGAMIANVARLAATQSMRLASSAMTRAGVFVQQYVQQNMGSFVQKGGEYLKNFTSSRTLPSFENSFTKKIKFSITSSSTLTAANVRKKIESYLQNRIAGIRSANPRANIKTIKNSKIFSPKLFAGTAAVGFDDFADAIELFSENIETIVSTEGSASAEKMKQRLMTYPPEKYDSLYRRTFELQHGWEISFVSFNVNESFAGDVMNAPSQSATSVSFSNNVPYTKWVQRRATQTWVHKGRWNTVEDVTEQESPELHSRIEQAIRNIID
jgi:hypothetical protein